MSDYNGEDLYDIKHAQLKSKTRKEYIFEFIEKEMERWLMTESI